MTRALAAVLALAFLLALPVAASGHEKESVYSSAFAGYFGDGEPVGMLGRSGLADPQPLTGEGENMRIVGNVPLEGTVAGSDIELAGDYAYVGSYGEGVVIINIKDPLNPKRAGVFSCPLGGQFDVQLQPGSNPKYMVMAIESRSNSCHKGDEGFVLVNIEDKTKPFEVAFVGSELENGGLEDGSHNTTMDWPYLYNNQYQPTHGNQQDNPGQIDIFDLRRLIADPTDKEPLQVLPAPGGGFHDLQVDHRPNGKVIGYGASIGFTDQLDLTTPGDAKFIGTRFAAAEHGVGISHGIEPNHNRTLAIESDEYGGGSGVAACGSADGNADAPLPPAGVNPLSVQSPGALHFLNLNEDGTFKTTGAKIDEAGLFNITPQRNPSTSEGCTAHVFWQAPDENRLVIAWYGRGTRIVDFSGVAEGEAPKEIGRYIPTNTETWSAKPHRGYIFTGDTVRGMDVLEYTGEDCNRWPTTAGAAEVQRDRYQGAAFKIPADQGGLTKTNAPVKTPDGCGPAPTNTGGTSQGGDEDPTPTLTGTGGNSGSSQQGGQGSSQQGGQGSSQPGGQGSAGGQPGATGSAAQVGGYRFLRAVRVRRGTRRTVVLEVRTTAGKRLAAVRYRLRGNRRGRAVVRASIGGAPSRYTYRIRAGKKVLKRGAFTVKTSSKTRVSGATTSKLRAVRRAR